MATPAEIEAWLFELEEYYNVTLDDDSFDFLADEIAESPSLDPASIVQHHFEEGSLSFVAGSGPDEDESWDEDDSVDPLDEDLLAETQDRIDALEYELTGQAPAGPQLSDDQRRLIGNQLKTAADAAGHPLRLEAFSRAFDLATEGETAEDAVAFVLNDPDTGQVPADKAHEAEFQQALDALAAEKGYKARGLPPAIVAKIRAEHEKDLEPGESWTEYTIDVPGAFDGIYGVPASREDILATEKDLVSEIARERAARDYEAMAIESRIGKHGVDETPVTQVDVDAARAKHDEHIAGLETLLETTVNDMLEVGKIPESDLEFPDPHEQQQVAEIAEIADAGRKAGVDATPEQREAEMAQRLSQLGAPDTTPVDGAPDAEELAAVNDAVARSADD